jgi:polysaccharide pyruvyl transferase WcaK-like protein
MTPTNPREQPASHIALWGAWYGSHNVGDQALLLTITELLASELGNVRFTVFTANPDHVRSYGAAETPYLIEGLQNTRQFHRIVATLKRCDLLVVGGGVPFFQRPKQLAIMATVVGLARTFGTPYITWSVASQRVDSAIARRIFRWVGQGASAVTYRDPFTAEMFRSCGLDPRDLKWAADPAFHLHPTDHGRSERIIERAGRRVLDRPLTAIVCRRVRHDHPYSMDHYNAKSAATIEVMIDRFARALDWMWEAGYQPLLLAMNTIEPDDDRVMAGRIIERARHGASALMADEEIRPRDVPAILQQCRLALVSRLHASVLAMVANCPMVVYSIGPKLTGIMNTMEMGEWVVEDTDPRPDTTVDLLRRLDADLGLVKQRMARRLPELQESARVPAVIAREILGAR